MIVVIDAYNILKHISERLFIGEHEREKFLTTLSRYSVLKKHELVVVFDGGPYDRPTTEYEHGITVIYAGYKQSADEVIQQFLLKNPLEKALVTSDRALGNFAEKRGVVVLDAQEFYRYLISELGARPRLIKSASTARKMHPTANSELDELMEQSTQHMLLKVEDREPAVTRKTKKLSKKEKKINKVIKKL